MWMREMRAALRSDGSMAQSESAKTLRTAAACAAVVWVWALVLLFPLSVRAEDALLYVAPPTALVTLGEEFTIRVMVNTGKEKINAAEGALAFDEEDWELVAIETEGSIFSSWVTPPSYNSDEGRIVFSGAVAPGSDFSGAEGLLFSVRLRALRNKASQVWFSQGAAVLAANGRATNILSQLRSGAYTITAREVLPALSFVAQAAGARVAPGGVIQSSTHPDPMRWYATSTALLRWQLPGDAAAVRVGLDQDPRGVPMRRLAPGTRTMRYADLPDGVSYFHLQVKDNGVWGTVQHYPLRVDTTPPQFTRIEEYARRDRTDPRVRFIVEGEDAFSGIAYFTASLNGAPPQKWAPDEEGRYTISAEGPGTHALTVAAYDWAGNRTATTVSFVVAPLKAPVLGEVPRVVSVGSPLIVRGTTYPRGRVVAQVRRDGMARATIETRADANGNFALEAFAAAPEGEYEIFLKVRNEKGAESNTVATPLIPVRQPKILLFGSIAVSYISMAATLMGALTLLGVLLWLVWQGGARVAGKVRARTRTAEADSFAPLESGVARCARSWEKEGKTRPLTRRERALHAQLVHGFPRTKAHISRELDESAAAATHPLAPVRIPKRQRYRKAPPR